MYKRVKIQIAAGIIISLAIVLGSCFWMISRGINVEPVFVKAKKIGNQKTDRQITKKCPDRFLSKEKGIEEEDKNCSKKTEEDCVSEGESIGGVYPGAVTKKCCPGLMPIVPQGIMGTQGICQKIKQ